LFAQDIRDDVLGAMDAGLMGIPGFLLVRESQGKSGNLAWSGKVRESQGKMIKSEKVREKSGNFVHGQVVLLSVTVTVHPRCKVLCSVVQIYGIGYSSHYIFNPLLGWRAMKWPWGKSKPRNNL